MIRNLVYSQRQWLVRTMVLVAFIFSGCENYLDRAPQATITDKDVFGSFVSFQGYVEEMYNCVIDIHKVLGGNQFYNFSASDEVLSTVPLIWDDGNYWNQGTFLYAASPNFDYQSNLTRMRVWPFAWYAIRKANLGLSKLDLLTDVSPEEKNAIRGQCLFFRAFFHFELMRFYGGLPYVDQVQSSSEPLTLPRLNYRETALKAARDFQEAAELLPLKWDDTAMGKATLGNNASRITKIHALSMLGKNLLYAASPMMNESSTGSNAYDAELCKQAADAFADVIRICTETGVYRLQSWATWTDNFWVWSPSNRDRPGGTEVIMNQTIIIPNYVRFTTNRTSNPVQFGAGNSRVEVPTHNFVKNYGMANGLPLDDPESGYNPNDPWTGRDPRFYVDIIYDGVRMVDNATAAAAKLNEFAQLANNGTHRNGTPASSNVAGSVTGYFYKKWTPKGCNPWDNRWGNFQSYHPVVRLADVYLMYAEAALHGYGTPLSKSPKVALTAADAVNTIRNRANLPNLAGKFTGSKEAFMKELIRERAVELAFEGHRFFDLRRWNIAGNPEYLQKTAIDFDRGANGKPINLRERVVVTRVFEKKHNWLPFQLKDTKLYDGFPQNPGW
ncbi:RagB/SusD family nutrient uptake outer membrane protein [Larkinella bovis]|uniref:RagB/SusD family nutrient uptake outer membrane protein n=1 Tax=Larkinella bovis TaxID=683041 RepID=A0ABW0I841_9BACT